jgi:hypothetical protein
MEFLQKIALFVVVLGIECVIFALGGWVFSRFE